VEPVNGQLLFLGGNFINEGELILEEDAFLQVAGLQGEFVHQGKITLGIFASMEFDSTNFNLKGGTWQAQAGSNVGLLADSALIVSLVSETGSAGWQVKGPVAGNGEAYNFDR
jgi:hypothetical protein